MQLFKSLAKNADGAQEFMFLRKIMMKGVCTKISPNNHHLLGFIPCASLPVSNMVDFSNQQNIADTIKYHFCD